MSVGGPTTVLACSFLEPRSAAPQRFSYALSKSRTVRPHNGSCMLIPRAALYRSVFMQKIVIVLCFFAPPPDPHPPPTPFYINVPENSFGAVGVIGVGLKAPVPSPSTMCADNPTRLRHARLATTDKTGCGCKLRLCPHSSVLVSHTRFHISHHHHTPLPSRARAPRPPWRTRPPSPCACA